MPRRAPVQREYPPQRVSLTLGVVLLGLALDPLVVSWLGSLSHPSGEGPLLDAYAAWIPTLLLAAVAGLGAHLAASAGRARAFTWPAPASLAALAALGLRRAPTRLYWLLGLFGAVALLALFLHDALRPRGTRARLGPLVLRGGIYLVAWGGFFAAQYLGGFAPVAAGGLAGLLAMQALSAEAADLSPPWAPALALAWVGGGVGALLLLTALPASVEGAVHLLLFHAGLAWWEADGPAEALLGSALPALAALALLALAPG